MRHDTVLSVVIDLPMMGFRQLAYFIENRLLVQYGRYALEFQLTSLNPIKYVCKDMKKTTENKKKWLTTEFVSMGILPYSAKLK